MLRVITIVLILTYFCNCARILGIVPSASYSHQVFFQPIWKELATKGHELVVITTNPINDTTLKTLREIDLSEVYQIWNEYTQQIVEQAKTNEIQSIFTLIDLYNVVLDWELAHPEVKNLIQNRTEYFDLVMIEYLSPIPFAFKHRFNCPFIGITSVDTLEEGHKAVGNPIHTLLYPDLFLTYYQNPTFLQRLQNVAVYGIMMGIGYFYSWPTAEEIVHRHFGKDYPSVVELSSSVDMIFTNTNPGFGFNRPHTPATVSVGGGIHIKPIKPLPKDLKEFLDGSPEGVIYFSLGTNVKSAGISNETRQMMLNVFSTLPFKVLWKFESNDIPRMSHNVKIMKWLPQQDVLRHPNIKVFVTQGGLQSLDESLFCKIPLVAIPFIADQINNALKVESYEIGLRLDYRTMSENELKETIIEVATNPKYKENISKLADRIQDSPMTGVEKAVWWTEYVIRHKGAQHLKGPQSLPFFQQYYLDVISFFLALVALILYVFYAIVRKLVKMFKIFIRNKEKTQ